VAPKGFTVTLDDNDNCADNAYYDQAARGKDSKGITYQPNSKYYYPFSRFDKALLETEIELRCKNYRNPVFGQILEGFQLNVKDREADGNFFIINYP
jgi:hypothetical protein